MKNKLFRKLLVAAVAAGFVIGTTACATQSNSAADAKETEADDDKAGSKGDTGDADASDVDPDDLDDDDDDAVLYISDDADEDLIVNQNYEDEFEPLTADKAGDLEATRRKFHEKDEEGDTEAVEEDMEEYKDVETAQDWQISALKSCYEDLGELFCKYGITIYDFNSPNYVDDEELDFDVYTDDAVRFDLAAFFDEDKELYEINIMED